MTSVFFALFLVLLTGCGEGGLDFLSEDAALVPRLAFESPTAAGATADDEITIGMRFTDVVPSDTWHLFYLSDAAPGRGGVVSRDIPVATSGVLSVTWVTSDLPAGDYYLFAEVVGGNSTATASAPGKVVVNHARPGNNSPTVRLTSPNGGESIAIGSTHTVAWEATDPDGDPMTAKIEFSRDGGTEWETLAEGVTGTSWDWQINAGMAVSNSCNVRVTVTDDGAGAASDLSDAVFSLYDPVTWQSTIAGMLDASCGGSACHSVGGAYAGSFVSDDYTNAAGTGAAQVPDRIVARSVDSDTMPPAGSGYPQLTEAQQALFLTWIESGMPEM